MNRKQRVKIGDRLGTVDYWCPSMAHVHFDDDPNRVSIVKPEDLVKA